MSISRRALALGLSTLVLCATAPAAWADQLADIRSAKKIRIAVAMGIPRFAFVDAALQPTGSDVETARMIAKDLGVELDLVQITNAARVPTIQTRKADILVASLAVTPERKKVIDFTVPYATLNIIVAGAKGVAVKGYPDIVGKRIGVTRATVNDMLVTQNAKGAEIVRFEDDATLITAAVSGQVDLVSTQEAVVAVMNEKRSDRPFEVKFVQSELTLGIALRQGEDGLKSWLNEWVKANMANGRLTTMFRKFHERDLPADLTSRG